ncbi:MAG TPA: WD40 repeat domain-containing protein [Kofleriaceae bacterium]|nr:WD40 repeat domain-containing protein [Kofleriaceae bacterium]
MTFPPECDGFQSTKVTRLIAVHGGYAYKFPSVIQSVAWTPDGQGLLVGLRGTAGVAIAAPAGSEPAAGWWWRERVSRVAEPDSLPLVVAGEHAACARAEPYSDVQVWSLAALDDEPWCLENCSPFALDGARLIAGANVDAGEDAIACVFDLATRERVRVLALATDDEDDEADSIGAVTAVSVLGERLLTGHEWGALALWDLASGDLVWRVQPHEDKVIAVALRDDAVISIDEAGTVRAGSPVDGDEQWTADVVAASVVAIAPDRMRAVCASGWTLHFIDLATGRELAVHDGHTEPVSSVAFVDNMIASGSEDGTVRIWHESPVIMPRGDVYAIAARAGRIASAGLRGTIAVDDRSWRCDHAGPIQLWLSPDGKRLLSLHEYEQLAMWDVDSATLAWRGTVKVLDATFSADGARVWVAASDDGVLLCDAATGEVIEGDGTSLADADAAAIVDGMVVQHRRDERALVTAQWRAEGGDATCGALVVSPDGKRAIAVRSPLWQGSATATLWDLQARACVDTIDLGVDKITACAFAPDSHGFAFGTVRGVVLRFEWR